MTAPPLRLHQVLYPVSSLGPGRRLGVWFQGCPLACRGCMSRDTWNVDDGFSLPVAELVTRFADAIADGADGVTISGGEPTAQTEGLRSLLEAFDAERARASAPGGDAEGRSIDFLVYTGYDQSELDPAQNDALRHADVVITGRFVAGRPTRLIWRGSANQRMWLRTPLGAERYAEHVDSSPANAPIDVHVTAGGFRIVGVPRRGDLAAVERQLKAGGLALGTPTWRPEGGSDDAIDV